MPRTRLTTEERRARHAARANAYYYANRDRVLALQATKRAADPEKYRKASNESGARWRAKHPERYRESSRRIAREYAARHKEERAGQRAAWAAKNPEWNRERYRIWCSKNRERIQQYGYRRRVLLLSGGCGVSREELGHLFDACSGKCAYCLTADATDVDHVQPLARGGRDELDNLVPACKSCNSSKKNSTLLELLMLPRRKVTQRMLAR